MKIFKSKSDIANELNSFRNTKHGIGFVPTMGALHKGHLSLVKKSLNKNSITVVSIFTNPTQFNNSEDYISYPQDLNQDCFLLKKISNNIIVFAPTVKDLYSNNIKVNNYDFNGLDKFMEGQFRIDHYNGVATVVEILFNIICPDRAYFGEKDYQQLTIIKNLGFDVDIIPCETLRDKNGLALSSRNIHLSNESQIIACEIYKNLNYARENFKSLSFGKLKRNIIKNLKTFEQIKLEYLHIADTKFLIPSEKMDIKKKYRVFIAVFIDGIRLIDNIALN